MDEALTPREIERAKVARAVEAANAEIVRGKELAAQPDAAEKAAIAAEIAGTPVGFAKTVLRLALYVWQAIVLSWFEDTTELVKGSLCTPNGAGKSERIVASLALWWISVHPQGMVVITTKDSKQLDNQIWPAIERHKGKFSCYDFIERMVRNGTGGFIIGFTTDDPGRAEGWHKINDFTGPLLVIGDEAKSIADSIHMALDRCTYNAKLLTSSPGLTEGLFYRSQTEPSMGFQTMKVGLVDCPHIPASRIKNIIDTYGPDHWFTRSTLHAEFTDADSETLFVIPKHVVRNLMDSPPPYVHGGKRAWCDFAAGRDENTFTLKEGNKISQVCWRDADPMRAVARFVSLFVENDLTPAEIGGDAGGMGLVYLSRFRELNWPIQGFNNESAAIDPVKFPSIAAEVWYNGAEKLARGDVIIPKDDILFAQLTSRRATPTSDGLLDIESKREMKKRNAGSPDRAEGVLWVLAADADLISTLFDDVGLKRLEAMARSTRAEAGSLDLKGTVIHYEKNSKSAWLTVWERPIIGRSYLCIVNPARHSEPLENHSLIVIRMGYYDEEQGKTVAPMLVAKVRKPLKLDAGPLARMVANLSGWYGKCMVIPVVNDRGDVIDRLAAEGVQMYVREDLEVLAHGSRNERMKYGWETDDYTRSKWIGTLSEAIRIEDIDIADVETVMQLFQLSSNNAARMRDAEAVGVALQLMNYATVYLQPAREIFGSPDTVRRRGGTMESMIS